MEENFVCKACQTSGAFVKKIVPEILKAFEESSDEQAILGTRINCSVCIGLFQKKCLSRCVEMAKELMNEKVYVVDSFCLSVSLPHICSITQHSYNLYLKSKNITTQTDLYCIKDKLKILLAGVLENQLKLAHDKNSKFCIEMNFSHNEEKAYCDILTRNDKKKYLKNNNSVYTNEAITLALQEISNVDKIENRFKFPPESLEDEIFLNSINVYMLPIYVAGRYNKYARNISQTPWGHKDSKSSAPAKNVEETISCVLKNYFKFETCKFSSSGREDVDVMMLGNGRPFVMELFDAKIPTLNANKFLEMQNEVNGVSKSIRITDLQLVTKKETSKLHEGQESKSKLYKALVLLKNKPVDYLIEKICKMNNIKIIQKTPLRVLRNRSVSDRSRSIYTIDITHHKNLLYYVTLSTQAGTYIKEFIHGDFGRTSPSLGDLLETECDILTLDVMSIDLDWPPKLQIK